MNKLIGFCLMLLTLSTVAEEVQKPVKASIDPQYKLVAGKMVRQRPLTIKYTRTPASPEIIAIHQGSSSKDLELIITSWCRTVERSDPN